MTPNTQQPRSASSSAILIATSVVGGLALLGATASAAFGVWMPDPWEAAPQAGVVSEYTGDGVDTELYADAIGVTSIEIDAPASDFTIEFDDVEEASLRLNNGPQEELGSLNGWTLERTDNDLVVERQTSRAPGDLCLFGCSARAGGEQSVTLTLPRGLGEDGAANLDVQVTAGQFTAAGSFNEVDLEVNAGALNMTGDARTLELEVNVGNATLELANVDEADVSVTTGDAKVSLTGTAPALVDLSAEVGGLTVQLPTGAYRVDEKAEFGSIDNRLDVDKASKNVVNVRAEAAEITLKS